MLYFYAFVAMFAETFLRGMQNKNVQGDHKKLAGVVGFFMTLLDIFVIHLVVQGGIYVGFFGAVGSGIGWIAAMYAHEYFLKDHYKAMKREQKEKLKKRIHKELVKHGVVPAPEDSQPTT